MKVLELVLKWTGGGVERYVEDLVSAAAEADIDCHVASVTTGIASSRLKGYGPLVTGGVKGALVHGGAIRDFVSNGGYDVVHVHGNNGLAFRFAHLARQAGAKTIVHSHNSSFGDGSRSLKALFTHVERMLHVNDCTAKFACSRAAGDFLFAGSGFQVALNGVDVDHFSFDSDKRRDVRARLGIPSDAPVLGFAASLVDAKNPLFAIGVFRELLRVQPDARFVVCGDGELLNEFEIAAGDLIDSGRCVCVGRVSDVESYYSAMDVLVAPSRYEGLPINLIEAQTNGLPIVMSDAITDEVVVVPSLCERMALTDGSNAWADRINEILAEKAQRSAVYSSTVSDAGYSQPDCFDAVFNAYRSLATGVSL